MLGEMDSLHVAEDARAPLFPVPGISSCMEVPAMDLVGRGGGAWKSPPQDHAFFSKTWARSWCWWGNVCGIWSGDIFKSLGIIAPEKAKWELVARAEKKQSWQDSWGIVAAKPPVMVRGGGGRPTPKSQSADECGQNWGFDSIVHHY